MNALEIQRVLQKGKYRGFVSLKNGSSKYFLKAADPSSPEGDEEESLSWWQRVFGTGDTTTSTTKSSSEESENDISNDEELHGYTFWDRLDQVLYTADRAGDVYIKGQSVWDKIFGGNKDNDRVVETVPTEEKSGMTGVPKIAIIAGSVVGGILVIFILYKIFSKKNK